MIARDTVGKIVAQSFVPGVLVGGFALNWELFIAASTGHSRLKDKECTQGLSIYQGPSQPTNPKNVPYEFQTSLLCQQSILKNVEPKLV